MLAFLLLFDPHTFTSVGLGSWLGVYLPTLYNSNNFWCLFTHRQFGVEAELVTPSQCKELWPLLRTDDLVVWSLTEIHVGQTHNTLCIHMHSTSWMLKNVAYMLCAKFGLGQSLDCSAQGSNTSFVRAIPGLSESSHAHYHCCARVHSIFYTSTLVVYIGWKMVHHETFKNWTKETFLFWQKVGSKVLLLLSKVKINFWSRHLFCNFPSSALYTSPSTIDFWSQFLCCTFHSMPTFSGASCILYVLDRWITCLQYSKMIIWHGQSLDGLSPILCALC